MPGATGGADADGPDRVPPEAAFAAQLLDGVDLNDLDALAAAFGEDLSLWDEPGSGRGARGGGAPDGR